MLRCFFFLYLYSSLFYYIAYISRIKRVKDIFYFIVELNITRLSFFGIVGGGF